GFVTTIAGKGANYPSVPDSPRDRVHGDQTGIGERLIEVPQQALDHVGSQSRLAKVDGLMAGLVLPGNRLSHVGLIIFLVGEADVKSLGGLVGGPAISTNNEGRVNATTQKSGNRHVGHALPLDGPEQSLRNRLGGIGEVSADA